VSSEEPNLAGEVDACAFVPLSHYLSARVNSSSAFDAERGKIPQDQELVHMGKCLVPLVCFLQV
jgi:hypothetical protein